jgi:hypothetical protein
VLQPRRGVVDSVVRHAVERRGASGFMAVLSTVAASSVSGEGLPLGQIDNANGGKVAIVNKDELARAVAARSGLDNGQAKAAVEATLEEIAEQIAALWPGRGRGHAGGDRRADRRRQRWCG